MGKRIYLIILTLVTVSAIIIGSMLHLWGAFGGFGSQAGFQEEVESYSNIEIKCDYMETKIREGNSFKVDYKGSKKGRPAIIVKEDTMYVEQPGAGKVHFLSWGSQKASLTIYVPKGIPLNNITAEQDVGALDIKNISAENVNITCDVGDVEINNAKLINLEASCDVGDFDMDKTKFDTAVVTSNVGDVDISGVKDLDAYEMNLSNDLGDIKVNGRNEKSSYRTQGTTNKRIEITNDIGDIKIAND